MAFDQHLVDTLDGEERTSTSGLTAPGGLEIPTHQVNRPKRNPRVDERLVLPGGEHLVNVPPRSAPQ